MLILLAGTTILFWKLHGFKLPSEIQRERASAHSGPLPHAALWTGVTDWLTPWRWGRGDLLKNTTATGGDMGAHVWTPDVVRRNLLSKGRLIGWSNDWFRGMPVLGFYFPLPSLLIAFLGFVIPSGIAFKLVTVLGICTIPTTTWAAGYVAGLRRPIPVIMSLGSIVFVLGRNYDLQIYGGNILSTMAGEFSFSISLSLAVLFVGLFTRVLRTGEMRGRTALCLAATALCHLLPTMWALGFAAFLLLTHLDASRKRQVRDTVLVLGLSAAVAGFWLVPFATNLDYSNDMAWEKMHLYVANLFPFWAKRPPSDAGLVAVAMILALIGAVASVGSLVRSLREVARQHSGLAPLLMPAGGLLAFVLGRTQLAHPGRIVVVGALAIVVLLIVSALKGLEFDRWPLALTLVIGTCAAVFVLSPQFRLWNARILPFWFFSILLLAAHGATALVQGCRTALRWWGEPRREFPNAAVWGTTAVASAVFVGVGMPLNIVPDSFPVPSVHGGRIGVRAAGRSGDVSPVSGWAGGNFKGYEGTAAWPEYHALMNEAARVGRTNGCGTAMWEYDDARLASYGTTLSLMLLPYWTKSCIGSVEGVYFESSATVPSHWLNAALVTAPAENNPDGSKKTSGPANPQRDLPYASPTPESYSLERGLGKLRDFGVRYYFAATQRSKTLADASPQLSKVGGSGVWSIYELRQHDVVSPLAEEPVVVTGIGQAQNDGWLDVEVDAYNSDVDTGGHYPTSIVANGPRNWQRMAATVNKPKSVRTYGVGVKTAPFVRRPLPPVRIRDIDENNTDITFRVDRVGVPVLVKTSYFPNWTASGASGPYRVMPNFMVVVPTSQRVHLHYGYSNADIVGHLASVGGIIGVGWLRRKQRRSRPGAQPVGAT